MSLELFYTSAERGLKPHSRGFCTVARSEGLTPPVIERLESLSSYQPLYAAGSPMAEKNPITFAHWRIVVGNRARSVLSRIAFVESDFSGRPGKFAHHVVLEPAEQWPAGPAAMLAASGVMQSSWVGEPKVLPPRTLSNIATPIEPSPAPDVSNQLADAFNNEPEKPVYLVYAPEVSILPIINEAIERLAPAMRWQVTFNTYFSELPAGLSCAWRCVVADTPAAAVAWASKALVLQV